MKPNLRNPTSFLTSKDTEMITLLIDNYDSFTWNVYQYLCQLGADVRVHRNDQITLQECIDLNPRNIVISPGPGHPSQAGVSNDVIRYFAGKVPILGVCLGEQAMYEVYGGTVTYAGELIHGKTSPITHDGRGLHEGLPQGFEVTRYHSLAGDPATLPDALEITSRTQSGLIMGIRHKTFVMEGVQYHPESISSEHGHAMFATFLKWEGGTWDTLKLRPDLVKPVKRRDAKSESVGGGVPISQASKMNSTSKSDQPSGKKSILETIKEQRLLDVAFAKSVPGQSISHLERHLALGLAPSLIDFHAKLLQHARPVAVLAEIKRASPSKGNIDLEADAPSQALLYASGGAAAISVLTEPKWFKGHLRDMQNVRNALESLQDRPAILRKDFIIDEYQVLEARCYGADTVLLIVAILSDAEIVALLSYSRSLGMEPLVEVATEMEMKRAVAVGAKIIGVNNRNLHTFEVDKNRTSNLSGLVPTDTILIALSGITCAEDVQGYLAHGARAVLVGEALMKSSDKRSMIRSLMGAHIPKIISLNEKRTLIKVCGITRSEDALVASDSGCDFIGLIFATSPRQVTRGNAKAIVNALRQKYPSQGRIIRPFLSTFAASHTLVQDAGTRPLTVGVFSNHSFAEINQVISECGIDLVQLHGDESPEFARLIAAPVIKVFHILPEDTTASVLKRIEAFSGSADFILLDTGVRGQTQQGGSGKRFNWDLARGIQDAHSVILAGGLCLENVGDALDLSPWCLDVSSGLESEKGIKDHDKVREFVKCVQSLGSS